MNYSICNSCHSSPSLTPAKSTLSDTFVPTNLGCSAFTIVRLLTCSGLTVTHIQPIQLQLEVFST